MSAMHQLDEHSGAPRGPIPNESDQSTPRGGANSRRSVPLDQEVADHLVWLRVHGYAASTLRQRAHHLNRFVVFLAGHGIAAPGEVTFEVLESYQRYVYGLRHPRRGTRLSLNTQAQLLISVKGLFSWLTKHGYVRLDPAAELLLPKTRRRLPGSTLTAQEAEEVLLVPDVSKPLGVRDRAILELLYSSAIRRGELIGLHTWDIDPHRRTLFVDLGKGGKDRHVPVGQRALGWVRTYADEVRPRLTSGLDSGVLFLSARGRPLCPDWLSRTVASYIRAGSSGKRGSCHLFRHTAATLMLDGGADIRYVADMLGHSKLETTQIYTRVSIAKLRAVHAACHPAGDGQIAPPSTHPPRCGLHGMWSAFATPTGVIMVAVARYYDPSLGRFTQPDTITHLGDLQQGNLYEYAGGDPVNNADPQGLDFWSGALDVVAGVTAIAAIGFAPLSLPALGLAALSGAALGGSIYLKTHDVGAAVAGGLTGFATGAIGIAAGGYRGVAIGLIGFTGGTCSRAVRTANANAP
jgi:integrase/recombinase XerD